MLTGSAAALGLWPDHQQQALCLTRGSHAGMCFVVGPVHSLNGVRVHGRLLPVVRRAGISRWYYAAVCVRCGLGGHGRPQ